MRLFQGEVVALNIKLKKVCIGFFVLLFFFPQKGFSSYQPNVVLVQMNSSTHPLNQIKTTSQDYQVIRLMPSTSKALNVMSQNEVEWQAWVFKNDIDAKEKAEELMRSGTVLYAEPNYIVHTQSSPNDPLFNQQSYFQATDLISLLSLTPKRKVMVAVIDTGIDYRHPDLGANLFLNPYEIPNNGKDDDQNGVVDDFYGANFLNYTSSGQIDGSVQDDNGHGTHLAGIIAAQVNNKIGISGLSNQTQILPVKFLDQSGYGNHLDGAAAIRYAVDRGAMIINCSWGNSQNSKILQEAIDYAVSKGVIIFAAAGNTGTSQLEYPAACPGVWGVGSVDFSKTKSYFSSFGSHVKYTSYGEQVYSCLPSGKYGYKSGTSQSTAILSGISASILSSNDTLSKNALEGLLNESSKMTQGLVSAQFLVENIDQAPVYMTSSKESAIQNVLNVPNPISNQGTYFGFSTNTFPLSVSVKIFNLQGKLIKTLEQMVYTQGYQRIFWDAKLDNGSYAENGTYLYVLIATTSEGSNSYKGKCSILI